MAKKEKVQKDFKNELIGILYVLIAIIGVGAILGFDLGPAGNLIVAFTAFIAGVWHPALLVGIFVLGFYLIFKGKHPNFFKSELLGLYLVIIALMITTQVSMAESEGIKGFEIIKLSVDNFMASVGNVNIIKGGGFVGSILTFGLTSILAFNGTKIVAYTLLIIGFLLFTGMGIVDLIKHLKALLKRKKVSKKEKLEDIKEIKEANEEYEKDNKIIVSSVEEVINHPEIAEDEPVKKEEVVTNKGYKLPNINLLSKPKHLKSDDNKGVIEENAKILKQVFSDFGMQAKVVAVNIGPSVTQYELELQSGTKMSKVTSINREIALALAAKDVRIQAPIPGKRTIGVELANKSVSMVTVREILDTIPKKYNDSKLLVTLGKDIKGKPIYCEINKTPHMLVAGATGSGKSVCINSIIVSILMRTKPDEVKLVMVDPKKVELNMYNGVPHLLAPVVTDPKRANVVLKKIVAEMENRYDIFSETGNKNIAGYNLYVDKKNKTLPEEEKLKRMPYIVTIIDELADLMLVAAKEVEDSIMRITQMARAAGIHLIVATQRPSTDVITGVVKANIPSRISFAVSSSIDSRTILDSTGAEKLLGKGDMLFLPMGENIPVRVQGTYLSEEEIEAVVKHTISQQKAQYDENLLKTEEEENASSMVDGMDASEEPLYNEIVEFVIQHQKASASLLQRRFRLGYNRAARVIDIMEDRGIIGPSRGSKPREVLIKLDDSLEK